MAGWQTIKLSDVVRTNVSTYSLSDNWEFVNYLDTGNIVTNEIALIQRIELAQGEKLPSRARRKVEIGDIIYSTVRPNQLHYGFIDNIPENFLVSTGFAVLHPEKGKIDAKFLYYLLVQNDITEKLQAIAEQSTSTYPSIKPSDIEDLDFIVPEIKVQRKISNILSAIDKKIELNAQINHNLEAQAQAIFKSWFVDFEPFQNGKFIDSELGSIPEGWRAGTLKEMLDIRYGKDHKKLSAGTIPVYGSGGLMRLADKALYSGESVLIPRKGTLNNVMRVSGDFWTVDTMFYSVPKCKGAIKFAFHVLRNMDLASMNSGSAVPSMTTDILNSIDIVVPPESVLASFEETTSALWNLDEANLRESNRLASLRDALLPKLMSGEIDVSEVEV